MSCHPHDTSSRDSGVSDECKIIQLFAISKHGMGESCFAMMVNENEDFNGWFTMKG